MTNRFCAILALLVVLTVGVANVAVSQDTDKASQKPSVPNNNPTTPTELAAAVEASALDPVKELRYEFMSHVFSVNGVPQEIYIKMDSFTGKTWRFHASTGKWELIAEASGGAPLAEDTYSRYEMLSHDYFDTYGEDQEMMMRVDMVSGMGWTYRGANGVWKEIGQDN